MPGARNTRCHWRRGPPNPCRGSSDLVRVFLGWVADTELPLYLNVADLMVFPYKDILDSGTASLGLRPGQPVLALRLGAVVKLRKLVGCSCARAYEGELGSAILCETLTWGLEEDRGQRATGRL